MNALGGTEKKDGNVRTAISAETGRKIQPGGKLPKIEKTEAETEIIAEALCGNTFMKSLAPDQRQKVYLLTIQCTKHILDYRCHGKETLPS